MSFFSQLRDMNSRPQDGKSAMKSCNNALAFRLLLLGYVCYLIYKICVGHLSGESEMSEPVFYACVIGMSLLVAGAAVLVLRRWSKDRKEILALLEAEEAREKEDLEKRRAAAEEEYLNYMARRDGLLPDEKTPAEEEAGGEAAETGSDPEPQ